MLAGQRGCVWIAYTEFPQPNDPIANKLEAWTTFPPTTAG